MLKSSVVGVLQFPSVTGAKQPIPQVIPVAQQSSTTQTGTPKAVSKTMSTSPGAKIIDLTEDEDSAKNRLVAVQPSINAASNPPSVRQILAPPGTQFVRTGAINQPTYQLVFNSPTPGLRPSLMVSVAPGMPQTTTLLQTVKPATDLLTSTTLVSSVTATTSTPNVNIQPKLHVHPAPFPPLPTNQQLAGLKGVPPKPSLKISRVTQGIVLSWNMTLTDSIAEISNYQLFAYQETSAVPVPSLWKKVGDVKALPLPMACTLTQFQVGNKYHFAVRAMDVHNRVGQFSDPGSILLAPATK